MLCRASLASQRPVVDVIDERRITDFLAGNFETIFYKLRSHKLHQLRNLAVAWAKAVNHLQHTWLLGRTVGNFVVEYLLFKLTYLTWITMLRVLSQDDLPKILRSNPITS